MKLGTDGHIKTLKLKQRLGLNKWQAVGILESLFLLAAQNAPDGNIGKFTNEEIALYLEYFDADADELINALIYAGYIDDTADQGLVIHGWLEHRPKYINDRENKKQQRTIKDTARTVAENSAAPANVAPTIPCQTIPCPTKPSPTKPKPETENAGTPALISRSILDDWNKCPGVTKCRRISKKRRAALNARLSEPAWCEDYAAALAKFPLPCWADGSYKPNIDWFLRPDTVVKIVEGGYAWSKNGKVTSKPKPKPPLTPGEYEQRELTAELQQLRQAGEGVSDRGNEIRDRMTALEQQTK